MASLHKQPGKPNWFCAFTTGADGKRHFLSTGTPDKRQAWQVCNTWAKAAAQGDKLTPDKARKVLKAGVADVLAASGKTLPSATIGDWCRSWLASKAVESEPGTHSRYGLAIGHFLEFSGERKASRDLDELAAVDVLGFRDWAAKRLSVASVNTDLRVLRACFNSAVRDGNLLDKCPSVAMLKEPGQSKRRALTLGEIRHVLDVCGDSDWRGLVLTGLYSGQRLFDCATLRWQQVDLAGKEIRFVTKKTGERLALHLAEPLAQYLEALPSADNPNDFVFPKLAEVAEHNVSGLSNAFAMEVLIPAGLMPPRATNKKSTGVGRTGKRQVNAVTFHSLRHSFVTLLKATGASQAIAELVVGHRSPAISRQYTHLSSGDSAEAIGKLPDVTGRVERRARDERSKDQ